MFAKKYRGGIDEAVIRANDNFKKMNFIGLK